MRSLHFLLFSLCFFSQLFCSYDIRSVATFEGEPSANVHDAVNTLTGTFYISEEDITVTGVEPLHFQRTYLSAFSSYTHTGWSFPFSRALTYVPVNIDGYRNCGSIHVYEHSGAELLYTTALNEKTEKEFQGKKKGKQKPQSPGVFRLHPSCLENALTNSKNMSGSANFKNSWVKLSSKETEATVFLGDGTQRKYVHLHKKIKQSNVFVIVEEQLSSGNWILYSYDQHARLSEVKTTSPSKATCYAWARFFYEAQGKDHRVRVETSDAKTYIYKKKLYKKKHEEKGLYFLDQVLSSNSPDETLSYCERKEFLPRRLCGRRFPEGRFLQVEYYDVKHNHVMGHDIYLKDTHDPRYNRVKHLYAPIGSDETPLPLYTFIYHETIPLFS